MSLVENLARRQHSPLELVHGIGALAERGYPSPRNAGLAGLGVSLARSLPRRAGR